MPQTGDTPQGVELERNTHLCERPSAGPDRSGSARGAETGNAGSTGLLVSVVISARNVAHCVEACLDCLLRQDHSNIEIVIADDCSTDATWSVIRAYADREERIKALRNTSQLWAGATRNRCIAEAHGDYIMLQDADDLCEPGRARALLAHIQESGVDFVSSGFYLFDDSGRQRDVTPAVAAPTRRDFLAGSPFCHAATMFTRECLEGVGGYLVSRHTRRGQDYDLFMRLYASGYRGENLGAVLYGYRVDANTLSRRRFRYRLDECLIRWRGFRALGLLPAGFPYVFRPIPAYAVGIIRRWGTGGRR